MTGKSRRAAAFLKENKTVNHVSKAIRKMTSIDIIPRLEQNVGQCEAPVRPRNNAIYS